MSDNEGHKQAMRTIELPPIHSTNREPTSDPFSHYNTHRRKDLLPSILSPPGRSSTLPPLQRHTSTGRTRKQSVSKRAREPQHKRQRSRGEHNHIRGLSHDRKAQSAEPSSAFYGKRWEDLLDAATSATEDVDDDRTPVCSCMHIHFRLHANENAGSPIANLGESSINAPLFRTTLSSISSFPITTSTHSTI